MSAISTDFHAFLNTIKADFDSVFTQAETAVQGTATTFLAGLGSDIEAAGPVVLQIVTQAVLTYASGGLGTPLMPVLNAAFSAIEKEGIVVADHVVAGLASAVVANLPTPSVPAGTSGVPAPAAALPAS
jgi:hypothetical protein